MTRIAREHPLFHLVLFALLAVLAYGTFRHLNAHAARQPRATAAETRALAESQGQLSLHITDANADVGPGSDEAALARLPSP